MKAHGRAEACDVVHSIGLDDQDTVGGSVPPPILAAGQLSAARRLAFEKPTCTVALAMYPLLVAA